MEELYIKYFNECEDLSKLIKRLEDSNLDLKVENFGYLQDVALLETRLQKYQQLSKTDQACLCSMTAELKKLKQDKEKSLNTINLLQQELKLCTNDLLKLQEILQTSAQVDDYNKKLILQLEELQTNTHVYEQELRSKEQQLWTKDRDLRSNEQELRSVQQELRSKEQEQRSLELELRSVQQERHSVQQELHIVQQDRLLIQQELRELQEELLLVQKELPLVRQELHTTQEELRATQGDLYSVQEELQTKEEQLQSHKEEVRTQNEQMCCQNEQICCQNKKICSQKDKICSQKETICSQQETICSQNDTISSQEKDLDTRDQQILHEQKRNQEYADRLEDLHTVIDNKTAEIEKKQSEIEKKQSEIERLNILLADTNMKHQKYLSENEQLRQQLEKSVLTNEINTEQTNYCHEEINTCLTNLQELKDKMKQETDLVNQKVLEYNQKVLEFSQLQALYNNQCCDMEILKREIDTTKVYYQDEIIALKHQIRDLTDKATKADCKCKSFQEDINQVECKCKDLEDDLKEVQGKLVETTEREAVLQQYYSDQEGRLMEKLHSSQNEEIRLVELTTALEKELMELKESLSAKDKQLESAKSALVRYKSEHGQKKSRAQEELNMLKNELNVLIQKQNALIEENAVLQRELSKVTALKSQLKSVTGQLDQSYNHLKKVTVEKDCLCKRNEELNIEMQNLYTAFNDMNEQYQYKTDSVMMELVDTKQNRETLCHEGRNVIKNVRSWISEQQTINRQLKNELRDKRHVINKLKRENESLISASKNNFVNQDYAAVPYSYRKKTRSRKVTMSPPPLENWELGSEGSSCDRSPYSSLVTNVEVEWYDPEDDQLYERPTAWVHRVESMTQDLQKTNQYWMKKLHVPDTMVSRDDT